MNFYKRSLEIQPEVIEIRRTLQRMPEVGFDLDRTVKFVKEKLTEICDKVPSAFFGLGMAPEDYPALSQHDPRIRFDEAAMAEGTALYAAAAVELLKG